jgi:hypothetical protein
MNTLGFIVDENNIKRIFSDINFVLCLLTPLYCHYGWIFCVSCESSFGLFSNTMIKFMKNAALATLLIRKISVQQSALDAFCIGIGGV